MDKRLLIAQPVATELERFNAYYKESVSSEDQRVQKLIDYVMVSDGKRIRPILLLLAAKACGEINEVTYGAAMTIELLHTASLIHDDVVDNSDTRRGKPSVNAVFDNRMAVLVGDYFLSTALIKAVMTSSYPIISIISNLGRTLAEGELDQLLLVKESVLDEAEYFEVIRKKTASLLSDCMRIGAISVDAPAKEIEKFALIGEILGMCFQMRDDIFDYYSNNVGKPTGNDIREGKVTLPLLYAIGQAPEDIRNSFISIIRSKDFSDANIHTMIEYAKANGGIEYTYTKIEEYYKQAEELIQTITNEEVRGGLTAALDYIVQRAY
ncbi:polyprenyl synthetase family protein [Dysgonomonas sp. 25]|uniref:polyprenyl synthetase family protein n=1 Tax=Dysgonomonas sp. 25 TaxID=2302933 RepID=UPI0013D0742B|nr:polyprenyl synthetase family protein [Dysgonomonas sp. 25]NDV70443.1 polyprenyl synthetase family protein [Dysgonomonas sp. 25]